MFWLKYAWLVVLAVISAVVLLWPLVRKALDGATLTPFDITDLINRQGAIVFDLREDSLFKAGHLPRSRHLTLAKLERLDLKRLQQKPLILVGDSQNLRQAKKILQQKGAQRIYIINDNFTAWKEASLPLEH
jgi:rhodanese-related sulfurtransferase